MPKRAVGIDLGTTFSVAAWIDESGRSQVLVHREGDVLLPSVVLFDDEEVLVGRDARKLAPMHPDRVAACVKRDMGSPVYAQAIRDVFLPPEVIQAFVLKRLGNDLKRGLGPNLQVVITVPAFFDEVRRKATADAGEMAGLHVLDIINEPTAAALAFGESHGYLSQSGLPGEGENVLVYDLGGGTFDVTIVYVEPGCVRSLATDGDVRLGGRDWDMRLVDHVAERFRAKHREDPRSNPVSLARLIASAEEAKRTLSARRKATVEVEHAGACEEFEVTRETFEEITADLLERTAYTARHVLASTGLEWSDISRVLLVGGATRMPMVAAMLQGLAQRPIDQSVHPDEAVARGAAIHAEYLLRQADDSRIPPAYLLTNVNAHSLGVEGIDPETQRKRNAIILPRNRPLPAAVTRTFATRRAGQRSILIRVLEGESAIPDECTSIGRATVSGLPPDLPLGTEVDVNFRYETNGRLTVTAWVRAAGRSVTLTVDRAIGLNRTRVEHWRNLLRNPRLAWRQIAQWRQQELRDHEGASSAPSDDELLAELLGAAAPHAVAGSAAHTGGGPASRAVPMKDKPLGPIPVARSVLPGPGAAPAPASPAATSPSAAATHAASPGPPPRPVPMATSAASGRPLPAPPPAEYFADTPRRTAWLASATRRHLLVGLGYVFFSLLGIAIGYYILCWLNPGGNFLGLDLPGIPRP